MEEILSPEIVVSQLWRAYTKTKECRLGNKYGIPSHHKLVEDQEKVGLKRIYNNFVQIFESSVSVKSELRSRTVRVWLEEWKGMHHYLFGNVLKICGRLRTINVRFGDLGDEDIYHIPTHEKVPSELASLANKILKEIQQERSSEQEVYQLLAKIHYEFIRIHPFADGNGRIARAITDQLALFYGFPVAMGGYPRHDAKHREAYHKAIRACADDPECKDLSLWIKSYINKQLRVIA